MHPEVMLARPDGCPICGMSLEPIYETQPELSRTPVVAAQIVAREPLDAGKKADLVLRLSFMEDGKPVGLDDLEETHTRKIHLLIIDLTQTDYHHVHPDAGATGEYTFSFTVRVWNANRWDFWERAVGFEIVRCDPFGTGHAVTNVNDGDFVLPQEWSVGA